jgi:hypothetical protein
MVRSRLRLVLLLVPLSLPACKEGQPGAPAEAAAVGADRANPLAEDLLARRDALMQSRQRIEAERAELEAERVRLVASGGDTSDVDRQLEEHRAQEARIQGEDLALADQMSTLLESARVAGSAQQQVAAREAQMASRERTVASREDRVAQREAALAAREKVLADRERTTCGATAPTTIIQTVDPKGAKYGKRDVEPVLKKARETMSKKGLLATDLPAQASGLEREATRAMADGDYGRARFAAQQLLATVEGQRVDRAFIAAKIGRLSAAMKGRTLEAGGQKEVDAHFKDATERYGNGDFTGANRKLNQIWRAIDR